MSTLDNLKKDARRWLRALRAGDRSARERLRRAYPNAPERPGLREIQHALAREGGHESWLALIQAVHARSQTSPLESLLQAASRGDANAIAAILDTHPGVINERGSVGDSGLRTALHFGVHHESVVRVLLERAADPNIRDERDRAYPIHFAAERGELSIVKLLVEHGADPIGAGTDHLLDAAGWAVCFDYATHVEVARYLLAHGAPFTLLTAAALGEAAAIRDAVRRGEDVNQRMDTTNRLRAPLHLAVVKRQPASVTTLIELRADLNARDATGSTALDVAALMGDTATAQMLLEAGAQVTLAAALALGRAEDADRILREDPEAVNNRLWARIVVDASARASGDVLDRVLTAVTRLRAGLTVVNYATDAAVAADGAHGYGALHQAAFYGNVDAIRVLLKHGANPRARESRWRSTPAGWAAHAGRHAALELLLQADIDIFDAIGSDRADVVARVLDRDPDAIDRPFKAYASLANENGQWWPAPDATPLEWARVTKKTNAARVLLERGAASRTPEQLRRAERVVSFLQFACWANEPHGKGDHRLHDQAAQRMLAQDPAIATENLYTAIVCGEVEVVRRALARDPDSARKAGGGRGWTPMLYLAFTRFTRPKTLANALEIARLLLDAGANPSDFFMAGDSQYSALVGAAAEGEQDSPRQPYAAELFELLLERGADPFDMQVLYNTHFSGDVLWWLEPVYAQTIDTTRGTAWQDPEWRMFDMGRYGTGARFILEVAIKHRNLRLAEWALARGANPNAQHARDERFPQVTLYEFAMLEQQPEMAELLARYGAARSEPALDEAHQFLDACLRIDRARATKLLAAHPEYRSEPFAMFEAARKDNPDAIALLLDLGVPLEIQDATGKRALHEAAWANAVRAAQYLIDRGAEIDPRESTYGGTPMGWAAHGDRRQMLDLLSRHTRAIWPLCFQGYVDRVREVLADDPSLARQIDREGCTPLWWLPDDDAKAMTVVELLLAADADPAHRNARGNTAADWARRRGMAAVAARLESAANI